MGQRLELLLLERRGVGQGQAGPRPCPPPAPPPARGYRERARTGRVQAEGHPWGLQGGQSPGQLPTRHPQLHHPRRGGAGAGRLTPMRLFSSPTVTCLARSTACRTCCWCWGWRGGGRSGEPPICSATPPPRPCPPGPLFFSHFFFFCVGILFP